MGKWLQSILKTLYIIILVVFLIFWMLCSPSKRSSQQPEEEQEVSKQSLINKLKSAYRRRRDIYVILVREKRIYGWIMLGLGILFSVSGYMRYRYDTWWPSEDLYFAFPRELDFLGLAIAGVALLHLLQPQTEKGSLYYWIDSQPFTMVALALPFFTELSKSAILAIVFGLLKGLLSLYNRQH